MILNPPKFQTMILQSSKNVKHFEQIRLENENSKIEETNTVKRLEIAINNKLKFEEHISEPCKETIISMQ